MVDLSTKLGSLRLKNPITVASGTFGYGDEMSSIIDLNQLGALSVKGLTLQPRKGNFPRRIVETPSGMLNAIGLQNIGVNAFIQEKVPFLEKFSLAVIANINGESVEDYVELAKKLEPISRVDALEINLSCPNVKEGGMWFGQDPQKVYEITSKVKTIFKRTIITKLSPNVTRISDMAKAVEQAGGDAVAMVNTFVGMMINPWQKKPLLTQGHGGLSGPAIKPIALHMVWQVFQNTKIAILGMGGIESLEDVLSFLIAGSSAIALGTSNFYNPTLSMEILGELANALKKLNVNSIGELIGTLEIPKK